MASAAPSTRRQTLMGQLEAFNNADLDGIMSFRADNCIHQHMPKSMHGVPMDNATFRDHFEKRVLHTLRNLRVTLEHVVEDDKDNSMVVQAHNNAETDLGPVEIEYMFVLFFNEDGTKVVKFLEYFDSAMMLDFRARLKAHLEAKSA